MDDYTDNTKLSVYYDSTDNLLHGYANNTEKYFNSRMPIPDYSKTVLIADEEFGGSPNWTMVAGHCLNQINNYWLFNPDSTVRYYNEYLSYIVPEDGFLLITCVANRNYVSQYEPFSFGIFKDDLELYVFETVSDNSTGIGYISNSQTIPVAKGDKIYYGTMYPVDKIPNAYRLRFAPVKKT